MDAAEVAWLAGLFEGEGCISFTGRNSVCLVVVMTDEDVVRRCREVTGIGTLLGPYVVSGKRKPQWTWRVGRAEDVEPLLQAMHPWFGVRRRCRAEAALVRLGGVRRRGRCKRDHSMSDPENIYTSPKGQRFCRRTRT